MLEISMVESVAGLLKEGKLQTQRPFRDPHHSCSQPAMVGGGKFAKPGEITLAHNGVLFLDELPEFGRSVLESLRQPLESGNITIARVHAHLTYPARFQLIAAMNPCKCGYASDPARACSRLPKCALDYQAKLSGPFIDRIDIVIEVSAIQPSFQSQNEKPEPSKAIAFRVQKARERQKKRFSNTPFSTNAQMIASHIEDWVEINDKGKEMLDNAVKKFGFSMRAYHRILRVALTIADLEESAHIEAHHIAEALSYRRVLSGK